MKAGELKAGFTGNKLAFEEGWMAEVAVVIADDFEDAELRVPCRRLAAAGHHVTIVGARAGAAVRGKRGDVAEVEIAARDLDPHDLDALVIPGGYSPDRLRLHGDVVELIHAVESLGKTVAAICHGPSLLIDADLVKGRTLTSWPSIRRDLENAGAQWIDEPVVEDGTLVTARDPGDLDAFSDAILRHLPAKRSASDGP